MQLELYEKKVLSDQELPIQLNYSNAERQKKLFALHWHEHLELHYIFEGTALMTVNQQELLVEPGDLIVVNSNELHSGVTQTTPYSSYVVIFDIPDLSEELAEQHMIFHTLIRKDPWIESLFGQLPAEMTRKEGGYKQMCRAMVLQLLVYLSRNHMLQRLPAKDSLRRNRDLERLNAVLVYIAAHYTEQISNRQLADLIHLSEDRFGHLFREGIGMAPLQYINGMRLKKAMSLLQTSNLSVTEVAETVGFPDYNHFGRLFRRKYGCTPNSVRTGK